MAVIWLDEQNVAGLVLPISYGEIGHERFNIQLWNEIRVNEGIRALRT